MGASSWMSGSAQEPETVPSQSISMKGQQGEKHVESRELSSSPLPVFKTAYVFTNVTEEFLF